MILRQYRPEDAASWDEFCRSCWQATFLHSRRFLSYHGTRFNDQSLILLDDDERFIGLFPAAQDPSCPEQIVSHPGITYGGLLHQGKLRGQEMINALEIISQFYRTCGYSTLLYKAVPNIYHQLPAQDDLYALFRAKAERVRVDLSCGIDLTQPQIKSKRRLRALKKADKSGLIVTSGNEHISSLWPVIVGNLASKHHASPVHSLEEMQLLGERFPEEINCIAGYLDGTIVAGLILFDSAMVSHAQYIAASPRGHNICALDKIFQQAIIRAESLHKHWFDFGISNEQQGQLLNQGLYRFKSEFGGGGIVHEFFKVAL